MSRFTFCISVISAHKDICLFESLFWHFYKRGNLQFLDFPFKKFNSVGLWNKKWIVLLIDVSTSSWLWAFCLLKKTTSLYYAAAVLKHQKQRLSPSVKQLHDSNPGRGQKVEFEALRSLDCCLIDQRKECWSRCHAAEKSWHVEPNQLQTNMDIF